MYTDVYKINVNGTPGVLNVSREPMCTLGEVHYPIRRRVSKNEAWGYVDFDYDVNCPDGEIVTGGVSPHDGSGVYVGGGQSWQIEPIGKVAYRLGDYTEIVINETTRTIAVDTTEAAERIPHIICGLMLLADQQERWEKDSP